MTAGPTPHIAKSKRYSNVNITDANYCSNKKKHRDSIGQIMVCSKQTGFDIEVPANLERNYFQTTVELVLAHRARSWTVTKSPEKAIGYAYTRMLRAVLNQLYGNIPPTSSTIGERRLRLADHCFRGKGTLSSDLILFSTFLWPKNVRETK